MYKCFVICPFGNKNGSEEEKRIHHERLGLKKEIFSRAVALCSDNGWKIDIEDGEADQADPDISDEEILKITAQRIDEADVIILVATTSEKPNTWIELGWADGFWQEPIFLKRDTFTLPTDVNNKRCLEFTTDILNGEDKEGAKTLSERLASKIEKKLASPQRTKRFHHMPETTLAVGQFRFYNRFSNAFSFEDWFKVLIDAKEEIVIASPRMWEMLKMQFTWIGVDGRTQNNKLSVFLVYKALEEQVKVTLLFQHPDNYSVDHMRRDETTPQNLVREELINSYRYWADYVTRYRTARGFSEDSGKEYRHNVEDAFRVIQIRQRYLPYRVTLTEKRAIVTLRFYTESVNSGMCIDAKPSSLNYDNFNRPFYEQIREELDFLAEENAAASEIAYQAFLNSG
jgi:hypothetical protein